MGSYKKDLKQNPKNNPAKKSEGFLGNNNLVFIIFLILILLIVGGESPSAQKNTEPVS